MTDQPAESKPSPELPARVRVVDVDIPFASMVVLILKWMLAAIPALIILAIAGVMLAAFVATLTGRLLAPLLAPLGFPR